MVTGIANPIADDGTGVNTAIHEIGVRNLSSYITGQTATVRLQIPNGTLNVNLTPQGSVRARSQSQQGPMAMAI